jgi:hypothetical protein
MSLLTLSNIELRLPEPYFPDLKKTPYDQNPKDMRTLVLGQIGKFDPCGRPMPVSRI